MTFRNPVGARGFSFLTEYPAQFVGSYGYRCKLKGSKRPEREAGLSPPSSTEVKLKGATPLINKCLRRIMSIKWTSKITKEELWRIAHQQSIDNQIKRRKWNWIGHTLHRENCIRLESSGI